ncbi:hypothetical protein RRG08_058504 [Elysia crispata]|uniref:Uncharacterized protein n=1 Tax=Elysia crispata TaxID=231223 RepID=A0AAE0ZW44_9GAST|nr:hypothetical protein RRG08_058504 [Elysia crispata]
MWLWIFLVGKKRFDVKESSLRLMGTPRSLLDCPSEGGANLDKYLSFSLNLLTSGGLEKSSYEQGPDGRRLAAGEG